MAGKSAIFMNIFISPALFSAPARLDRGKGGGGGESGSKPDHLRGRPSRRRIKVLRAELYFQSEFGTLLMGAPNVLL